MANLRGVIMTRVLLLVLAILSQVSAQNIAPPKGADPATAGTVTTAPLSTSVKDSDYVIGTEDVLQVSVWKEPDVSSSVPVRSDGKISLPLLGDVQAAGMTPTLLAADISVRLKEFMAAPRVTVIVTAMNSRRAYVMGQVMRQGAVAVVANLTVLQAISSAGGVAQYANVKKIYILRTEGGKQRRIPFNYEAVIKGRDPEQNIILKPGDTIVVP
jgi:polysaccharide export outer membrane protein